MNTSKTRRPSERDLALIIPDRAVTVRAAHDARGEHTEPCRHHASCRRMTPRCRKCTCAEAEAAARDRSQAGRTPATSGSALGVQTAGAEAGNRSVGYTFCRDRAIAQKVNLSLPIWPSPDYNMPVQYAGALCIHIHDTAFCIDVQIVIFSYRY